MRTSWLIAGVLLVSSLAFAGGKSGKPTLGTFRGTNYVATAVPGGQLNSTPTETVKVRVNGQRLYVTQKAGTWVQSFRITGDRVGQDGVRVIDYIRDSGYGVGKRNEARLDAAEPGATLGYRGLSGYGSVTVASDGRISWHNLGQARIQGVHDGRPVDVPVAWNEKFLGAR